MTRVVICHPEADQLRELTIAAFTTLLDYRPLGKIICHERNGVVLVDIVNYDVDVPAASEFVADSLRPNVGDCPIFLDAKDAPDELSTPWIVVED